MCMRVCVCVCVCVYHPMHTYGELPVAVFFFHSYIAFHSMDMLQVTHIVSF